MDTAENQGLENKALGEQGLQDKSSDGKDAEDDGQQDQPAPEPSATTTEDDVEAPLGLGGDDPGEPGAVGPTGGDGAESEESVTPSFDESARPSAVIAEAAEEEGLAEAQESHDTDSDAAHDAALSAQFEETTRVAQEKGAIGVSETP